MKHKRMAVLFVMVTFVGSPPVWQKLGNFIAAIQHRAQIKFLSMVLSPGEGDSETLEVPTSINEHVAACPAPTADKASNGASTRATSNLQKIRSKRRDAAESDERNNLTWKLLAKAEGKESRPHLEYARPQAPNRLTTHSLAAVPKELATEKIDIQEVVLVPQANTFALAYFDDTNLLKIKKIVEAGKASRQRNRYVIGRPIPAVPASKPEATSSERSG